MSDETAKPAEPRPFTGFLHEQRRGALHAELSEKLSDVVAAVMEHGKKGKLVLTLEVIPEKADGMVKIADGVKVAIPEGEKSVGLFYADENGGVHKTDPRQTELPLGVVPHNRAASA